MTTRIKLKECEKKDKYFDLVRKYKKNMEFEGDNYTKCDWCLTKGLSKGMEDLELGGQVETIQTQNSQNPEKSPGNLRRLALTQTPVKDDQQTL